MNAQMIQDWVVLATMVILRIGLPMLLVMGVGHWLEGWLQPHEAATDENISLKWNETLA